MNTADLRLEVKKLIDNEADPHILEAIKTLLNKTALDPELRNKLTSRALKSEDNIAQGKTLDRESFESNLKEKLGV